MNGTGSTSKLAPCIPRKDVKLRRSFLYWEHRTQYKQALAGGPPVQITHFEEPLNYFDWSPDGKKLLVSRSSTLSDAVLITHFR